MQQLHRVEAGDVANSGFLTALTWFVSSDEDVKASQISSTMH